VARADMESANTAAPIVTSGGRDVAGRVIGVERCGGDPGCPEGDQSQRKASDKFIVLVQVQAGMA